MLPADSALKEVLEDFRRHVRPLVERSVERTLVRLDRMEYSRAQAVELLVHDCVDIVDRLGVHSLGELVRRLRLVWGIPEPGPPP